MVEVDDAKAVSLNMESPCFHRRPVFRLLALPPELITSIADATDALGDATLLDLRLTSYAFSTKSPENPRLRKYVTVLSLAFPAAAWMHLERHCRRLHKFGILCDSAVDKKPGGQLECLWSDVEGNEHAIEESCSKLREAALENLKGAGIISKIHACGHDEEGRRYGGPYGMSALHCHAEIMGLRNVTIDESSDSTAVSRTLVAIARTQFPVAQLDISSLPDDAPYEPEAFAPMVAAWSFPWATVIKLQTTIHSSNLQADSPKPTAFRSWLSSLRALKHLDIGFEQPDPVSFNYEGDDWTRMLSNSPWIRLAQCSQHAPLTELRIETGRFGKQGVLILLKSHYMALEHLHVGDVSNNGGEVVTASGDNEFILTGSPEIVKQLLLEQRRTMHFTDDFASVSDEAEDAEQAVANGEDEYGPDFNDSDLQIADQVEPHG